VTTASSGEKALAFLKENTVDLVILDMIMEPGLDGLETFQEIMKINPEQKVMIASGYAETERVKIALERGVGQYIKKPYTMEKIGTAVRTELDR
jgi:YesN/AraC family two-component response regulator